MSTPNNKQKWAISAWSALPFLIFASPVSYWLTNLLLSPLGIHTSNGGGPLSACPTSLGFVLHTIVFFFVVRAMMEIKLPGSGEKYKRR